MEPAIPAGARLRLQCLAPASYRTGQVIAFMTGDGICVHRVVHRGRWRHACSYLITKGDDCAIPDAPVHLDSVLGVVTEYAQGERWRAPGPPPRGRSARHLARLLVRLTLAACLEIDLRLAERLTQSLWTAAAALYRARAGWLPRSGEAQVPAIWDSLEMQLLAACARARPDERSAAAIRAILPRRVDWKNLLFRAECHGMLPLLYHHLSGERGLQVPVETMRQLRSAAEDALRRSLFMTGHLLKVVRLLQQQDIAVIPIKGPVLAVRVYGDVGLRQHADLDILVQKTDIQRVKEVLGTVGYQPEVPRDGRTEEIHLESDKDLSLVLPSGICLEVHHALTPPYSSAAMDRDGLPMRTVEMSLLGTKVRVLGAEDELLYLCLNGAAHAWSRLEYVCAVAEMVRQHPHLDWSAIERHARTHGSLQALFLGLLLAQQLLGAPLPPHLALRVHESVRTRRLAAGIRRRLNREPPWSSNWENVQFLLSIQDGVGNWLRAVVRFATVPTGTDAATFPLPRPLHFLYHVLRPLHLLYRYARDRRRRALEPTAESAGETPSWAQP